MKGFKECDMCGLITRGSKVGDKCPECMQGTLWRSETEDDEECDE